MVVTTQLPMCMQSIRRQKKRQTWSRTQRRENREFLTNHLRNGEVSNLATIIRVIYYGSKRDARKYLLYS
jgi:hypothetical protein